MAQNLLNSGVDVVLGGGGTGRLLRQKLKGPVVTIGRSYLDIIRALVKAKRLTDYIAITSYGEMPEGLDLLAKIMEVRLRPVVFGSTQELVDGISRVVNEGVKCVVGGGVCVEVAKGLGCRGFTVLPSPMVIQRALDEATNIANSLDQDRKQAAWLAGALDSLHEGIIGVDKHGEMLLSNTNAVEFLEINPENRKEIFNEFIDAIGMHKVLEGGGLVPDRLCSFKKRSIVTNIRPILINREIEGALAAFRPATYLRKMSGKLRRHDKRRGFMAKYTFADLIGDSESMRKLRDRAQRFAKVDANIFIQGESGTGKELLAHAIHVAGPRSAEPFVAVNCAALPDTLLESELFGYEEGAFTGASKGGKEGLFLLADKGTIFLDEIADISPQMQVRLLRVLESQEILQVGGSRVIPISVRILSSSWKDLARETRHGRFRADLYYRLNTLNLTLPPLRHRIEDLPVLCDFLLRNQDLTGDLISAEGMAMLQTYHWPGNVRELDTFIHRYALLADGTGPDDALLADLLQELADSSGAEPENTAGPEPLPAGIPLKALTERFEKQVIKQILAKTGQNKKLAAQELGISENTLWRKMKSGGPDF